QIWIAVSVYVLVAIVRKRLRLEAPLYTLLQVFSVAVFEKIEIQTAFRRRRHRAQRRGTRGRGLNVPRPHRSRGCSIARENSRRTLVFGFVSRRHGSAVLYER